MRYFVSSYLRPKASAILAVFSPLSDASKRYWYCFSRSVYGLVAGAVSSFRSRTLQLSGSDGFHRVGRFMAGNGFYVLKVAP